MTVRIYQTCCVVVYLEMKIVAVEGNVGAGKSTLLGKLKPYFQSDFRVKVLEEPVHIFEKFNEHNPLELMYKDPFTYASFSQLHILESVAAYYREQLLECAEGVKLLLCERSLFSPIIFSKVQYRNGYFEEFVYDYLVDRARKNLTEILPHHIFGADVVLFLSTSVENCLHHINVRCREGENNLDIAYLKCIEECYYEYLENFDEKCVEKIDINVDIVQLVEKIKKLVDV